MFMPGFSDKALQALTLDHGPKPSAGDVDNGRDALTALASVSGIPSTLVGSPTAFRSLASGREGYRRFLFASVSPVATLLAVELSDKLDADISFTFEELRAGDISGRAGAYRSLVEAGYSPVQAATACGLEAPSTSPTAGS